MDLIVAVIATLKKGSLAHKNNVFIIYNCKTIQELSYTFRWTTMTGVYMYEICVLD